MARLATGIEGFDAMIQGGLPEGSSVLLQGPPGQEKLRFALTFLAEGLKAGGSGLVVISSQSPDNVLAELRDLGVNLDAMTKANRLRVVDWYSWSEEPVEDVEERGAVVRSSIDLTNLGVALSRAIAGLAGDLPRRAVIEILSPATNVYEVAQVYAFAQSAKKKFDRSQFTSLVLVEKDMHTPSDLTTLHQPFDGVIEIERSRSGDRIVRKIGVLHLKDTAPDPSFRILEVTEDGLKVVREASKPAAPMPSPGGVLESQEERARRLHLIMQIASERLKLNPSDADALFALAAAQATLDDAKGGVQSLDRLAALDPNYPGLWVLKTKLHARLGETDLARQSRTRAQQGEPETAKPAGSTVPCPMCEAPVPADATSCENCGVRFAPARSLEEELEDLEHAAIQEMVQEELAAEPKPDVAPPAEVARKSAEKAPSKPSPKKGMTNGLVLQRGGPRRAGMTNGLRGRTNGLRGRTNGLTNGLGRTNGLANGVGRTNGLTNGLGRTNGLTNGLGRTNGLTNGLGRTNGLTNGLGRTNGITNGLGRTNGLTNGLGGARPSGFRSSGLRGAMRNAGWKLYLIPLVSVALLLMPLFLVPEYRGPAHPIRIDGVFDDWTSVSRLDTAVGSVANANVDVVRFGAVDNLGPFAFYVQVRGVALQGGGPSPGTMDTFWIFIDIDASSLTGYRIDGLGADRMIEVSGYGGTVLASGLWEFDANRDARDWNGWIKGTGTPAVASGSQIEAEAEWVRQPSTQTPVVAAVRTESWDRQGDSGDFPIGANGGTLAMVVDSQVPAVVSGANVPLARLTLTAFVQPVAIDSILLQSIGTAPATAASSLRLLEGGNPISQTTPTSRDVTFTFPSRTVAVGTSLVWTIAGDFSSASGETFGIRVSGDQPLPVGGGIVAVRDAASPRTVGYLGAAPSNPRVDGGFGEWTAPAVDPTADVAPRNNPSIDLAGFGSQRYNASTYLYADVTGRILTGTAAPGQPKPVLSGGPAPADTDRDAVPDTIDPMPFDFNNDGTPDAQTNGDYDADGVVDYGFPAGVDYWLNTTLPNTFPPPYAGLSVSVYIGPTYRPPLLGDDVLRFFLDTANSTGSGYAIGGIGADRLVELRGKDGQVTQTALLAFSGSFPGQWSWNPISPVTVALSYHTVELFVPLTATDLYLEAGDFWGSIDSTTTVPAFAPASGSFKAAPADSLLSVPWTQVGPTSTLLDGGSNSATTVYNHQRKVVRAGDVGGQTACDATDSDGCWYVLLYDQTTEDSVSSGPTTETITAGSKISGTFSTDVLSSNNAYINYREADTGASTVVTRAAGATGTNPTCAWSSCVNGEASDNSYATSSTDTQILSYKTFGFSVPSGATITSVRVGIESRRAGSDDNIGSITLSWNAGTNTCSNTQTFSPPSSDPNAYSFLDFTTCTGHTWAQSDFTGDNIAFQAQYAQGGGSSSTISVDSIAVEVTYTPIEYTLSVRHDFSSVPAGDSITLSVEAYHTAGEDFAVQVLTPPSTWTTRITITATADPNTAQTSVLTSTEYNSGSPAIRFVDTVTTDLTASDVWIDLSILTTTMTKSPTTETITTGTKVSGTFTSDIASSNNAYINYREANTGIQTTVTRNGGAVGTSPACGWTNCANGEASDNSYATSSSDGTVLSFKTFGFTVPSDVTIDSVRVGIESFTTGNDKLNSITISWDSGTTYCSNTDQQNLPGSDTNAYTYSDFTTCTGHTWAQADFTGDKIAFKAAHSAAGPIDTISVDAVVVEVKYTPLQYQLSVRHDFANVPTGDVQTLKVEAYHTAGEEVAVQVLTPPSTWTTRITITATADPNTAQTSVLTSTEYNSGSPAIRFVDASGSDTAQSDLWIDLSVITTTTYWDRISLLRSVDTSGSSWGTPILLASGRVGDDPLLYAYDSAEPSVAMDSAGYIHVVWVSAGSAGSQQTLNRLRYTKTTVAYPNQAQLTSASNWQSVTVVDDASLGYMPTVSTGTSNHPHLAWSGSKTSGTVYYKNMYGGSWKPTVSWGATYTGISVDVSPQNNYVNLVRYYEAATNEVQYTVCKDLTTSNCDASGEFTKWDGTAGYDTVATSVETGSYPSLATTYDSNGDLWIAYAKDVDGTTRAIYARFLDYPGTGFAAAETVDSLSGTRFTHPTIGVDKDGNVHALYATTTGSTLYYTKRTGSWGSPTSVDTSADDPSLVVRAPNDATYGSPGAVYWKTSSSETYFYYIPEFDGIVVPVGGALVLALYLGRRARSRRSAAAT